MSLSFVEKPAIVSEIPKDRHVVIEASAGTGKTFTLENLLVDLVLGGTRIDAILVVTYTEKATAELRRRVRSKLQAMLDGKDGVPEVDDPTGHWRIDAEARERLKRALHGFDSATISTIHAFCQRVLTEHAFLNQRLFGETAVDGRVAFGRAFTELVRTDLARVPELSCYLAVWLETGRSMTDLEELLVRSARAGDGQLRPVFSASGLAAALEAFPPTDPGQVEAVLRDQKVHASTVRATVERVTKLVRAVQTARESGDHAKFLQTIDELEAPKKGKGGSKEESGNFLAYLTEHLPELAAKSPQLADLQLGYERLVAAIVPFEAALVQSFLPIVTRELDRTKREAGVFDFDDMLLLLDRALDRGERSELLLAALRRRYHCALIDEFQDTDPIQWRIFRRIFFDGRSSGLYVIGDPKQAIYGFRGADVHTYLGAKQDITQAGGALVSLKENFRSTEGLIAGYNRILDQNAQQPLFDGPIRYDQPVTCGSKDLHVLDGSGASPRPIQILRLLLEPGQNPLSPADVREILAEVIADEIRGLLDRPWRFCDPRAEEPERPLGPGDIHVLTRTSGEGLLIGAALRSRSVPFAYFKQDGLFQTPEAREIRDLLAAVADPEDRSKRLKAWLTAFFGLRLEDLQQLSDVPLAHPIAKRLYDWRAIAEARDYASLFTRIVEDSGIVARELFFRRGERALTNYLHLFEVLLETAGHEKPTLPQLVARLDAMIAKREFPAGENPNVQRLETEQRAVQIMTVHKAKGLEAPIVFLFGGLKKNSREDLPYTHHGSGQRAAELCKKSRMTPEVRNAVEAESVQEAQRLLYVAVTRAKARLYLPLAGAATYRGVNGEYSALDRRLEVIASSLPPDDPCFEVRDLSGRASGGAYGEAAAMKAEVAARLEDWRPERPPGAEDEEIGRRISELRRQHAGFMITSYSRMKALSAGHKGGPEAADDVLAEPELAAAIEPGADDLPPGTASGVFIHELLERVPPESFAGGIRLPVWQSREEVRELISGALLEHNLEPRYFSHAAAMMHAAFTTPIDLGGVTIEGLHTADKLIREMEFLYPMPEAAHPRLGTAPQSRLSIERGFIKGFVDLVFEHRGKVYFGDWKSDLLPSYEPRALEAYILASYHLQIKLYSLAFVKLLGIRTEADYLKRFGGALYLFLRGMRGEEGVWHHLPTWQDVLAWEEELIRDQAARAPTRLEREKPVVPGQTPGPITRQVTFGFAGIPSEEPLGSKKRRKK